MAMIENQGRLEASSVYREFTIGLLSAFIGAVATIAIGAFGFFNKDKELDIQLVNIALTILSGKHDTEQSEEARKFALRALSKYSNVDIPQEEFLKWSKSGVLPQGSFQYSGELRSDIPEFEELVRALPEDDFIALTLTGEAGLAGTENEIIAIASVIFNRREDSAFPNNIYDVILQDGVFSVWASNLKNPQKISDARRSPAYGRAKSIAIRALDDNLTDPTSGALYYHSDYVRPKWRRSLEYTNTIGRWLFYKRKPQP
ncbi:cell wall hydrolase [Aurantimonas sp. C2-6-R+9]|uniref:cell wall hydrolase n=1 Tax=unclassified Aurantimonas TaxID=2638230 RepID=UPI002E192CB9|nr:MULTISPECIES: cell wall hydrolase [unclassified Aurantimonas]MEC5291050.1 cell wall hydrolase [Aurantimonas sp. C2-3-R2]MEC5381379.1 cell wall hydrolase [Aurantimonas sp. C2-6-R+9]MEC5412201.1 cell wall hydrolase [Aurantimonas sp. C2-4-R8]